MAITASIVNIRGKAYEPIIEELLFENSTVAEKLVAFETDVKSETIFTENFNTVTMQAYTAGKPTAQGAQNVWDYLVTPTKVLFYDEFNPDALRSSRFKRDMKPGAWNTTSTEFEKVVLQSYSAQISSDTEVKFWTGITAAQKTAIAALTPGAGQGSAGVAEQAWAAAQAAALVDGVISRMIYNASNATATAGVGARIKVAGTTITSSNIAAEYAKLYAAIPGVVLLGKKAVKPYIYAPYSHLQLINIFNITQTYRDLFVVKEDKAWYNGIEIKFVPLPENCMIASRPNHLVWCCDLLSDINEMKVMPIENASDMWFMKNTLTQTAHVVNQRYNVLYLG